MLTDFRQRFIAGFTEATTSDVGLGGYSCVLDGHQYLIDESSDLPWHYSSVPLSRPNLTSSEKVGENTVNPVAGWRRSVEDWSKGAGQTHLDAADSDPARFQDSLGVDPWTRWTVRLLPDVTQVHSSAALQLPVAATGNYLYVGDGTNLVRYPGATVIPVGGAAPITSIAIDDVDTVHVAAGPTGTLTVADGAGVAVPEFAAQADIALWAKGRLFIATGGTVSTPATAFTYTAPGTITSLAESDRAVYVDYMYGTVRSAILRIGIDTDGSTLLQPIVAARLPDGELVLGLCCYLGFVLIGTTLGVRMASTDSDGNLTVGSLIESGPCYWFEPEGRFVWFQYPPGLGRLDMSVINTDAPAYATDLQGPEGAVEGICTYLGKRTFSVAGSGVWTEADTPVDSGWVDSGVITYGISDTKRTSRIDLTHDSFPDGAGNTVQLTADGVTTDLGSVAANASAGTQSTTGRRLNVRQTLTATSETPVLGRWTLIADPSAVLVEQFVVPVVISSSPVPAHGSQAYMDVAAELEWLRALRASGRSVTYTARGWRRTVSLTDFDFYPAGPDDTGESAIAVLTLTAEGVA